MRSHHFEDTLMLLTVIVRGSMSETVSLVTFGVV